MITRGFTEVWSVCLALCCSIIEYPREVKISPKLDWSVGYLRVERQSRSDNR
jgi:hypothetical protein